MTGTRRLLLVFAAGAVAACGSRAGGEPARAAQPAAGELERRIGALAAGAGGAVGVGVVHVQSGTTVLWNGSRPFPMASVYKLPIAIALLHRVDAGEIRLDSVVRVHPREFAPPWSPLAESARGRPVDIRVDSLLVQMLGGSDNTASDILLRMAGGPAAVTRRLRALGVDEVRVDRSEQEIAIDQSGLGAWPAGEPWSVERFAERAGRVPEAARLEASARFARDPRDTATPRGAAELLVRLAGGAGLPAGSRDRLIAIMAATPTGPNRLRGRLPPGTRVAHKTGTWRHGLALNDVGLISLPNGRGELAVAVLITGSARPDSVQERTIAEISRAAYDHFAQP